MRLPWRRRKLPLDEQLSQARQHVVAHGSRIAIIVRPGSREGLESIRKIRARLRRRLLQKRGHF